MHSHPYPHYGIRSVGERRLIGNLGVPLVSLEGGAPEGPEAKEAKTAPTAVPKPAEIQTGSPQMDTKAAGDAVVALGKGFQWVGSKVEGYGRGLQKVENQVGAPPDAEDVEPASFDGAKTTPQPLDVSFGDDPDVVKKSEGKKEEEKKPDAEKKPEGKEKPPEARTVGEQRARDFEDALRRMNSAKDGPEAAAAALEALGALIDFFKLTPAERNALVERPEDKNKNKPAERGESSAKKPPESTTETPEQRRAGLEQNIRSEIGATGGPPAAGAEQTAGQLKPHTEAPNPEPKAVPKSAEPPPATSEKPQDKPTAAPQPQEKLTYGDYIRKNEETIKKNEGEITRLNERITGVDNQADQLETKLRELEGQAKPEAKPTGTDAESVQKHLEGIAKENQRQSELQTCRQQVTYLRETVIKQMNTQRTSLIDQNKLLAEKNGVAGDLQKQHQEKLQKGTEMFKKLVDGMANGPLSDLATALRGKQFVEGPGETALLPLNVQDLVNLEYALTQLGVGITVQNTDRFTATHQGKELFSIAKGADGSGTISAENLYAVLGQVKGAMGPAGAATAKPADAKDKRGDKGAAKPDDKGAVFGGGAADGEEKVTGESGGDRKKAEGERSELLGLRGAERFRETQERLDMIIRRETVNVRETEKLRKESGWFGAFHRGLTLSDPYELDIKNSKQVISTAEVAKSFLEKARQEQDPAKQVELINRARRLAGIREITQSFAVSDKAPTSFGLNKVDTDTERYRVEQENLDVSRDVAITVATTLPTLGAGALASGGTKAASMGISAVIKQGAIEGAKVGATMAAAESTARNIDDVSQGEKTVGEAMGDVATDTVKGSATGAVLGGVFSGGGRAIGKGIERVRASQTVSKGTPNAPSGSAGPQPKGGTTTESGPRAQSTASGESPGASGAEPRPGVERPGAQRGGPSEQPRAKIDPHDLRQASEARLRNAKKMLERKRGEEGLTPHEDDQLQRIIVEMERRGQGPKAQSTRTGEPSGSSTGGPKAGAERPSARQGNPSETGTESQGGTRSGQRGASERAARGQSEKVNPRNRLDSKTDKYNILGFKRGTPFNEAKQAYRAGARKWHPDLDRNNPHATQNFQIFQNAWEKVCRENRWAA